MRTSIRERNTDAATDQLYQPLRETMTDPNNVQRHAGLTPIVAKSSMLSRDYHILQPTEIQRLVHSFPSRNRRHLSLKDNSIQQTTPISLEVKNLWQ